MRVWEADHGTYDAGDPVVGWGIFRPLERCATSSSSPVWTKRVIGGLIGRPVRRLRNSCYSPLIASHWLWAVGLDSYQLFERYAWILNRTAGAFLSGEELPSEGIAYTRRPADIAQR